MKLDVLGLIGACSYALDCVEAELVHVTNKHAKRVAYMSVCTAMQMGISLSKAYALTREADFPIVRVGKRVLVPVSEFKVWLSARATEK